MHYREIYLDLINGPCKNGNDPFLDDMIFILKLNHLNIF